MKFCGKTEGTLEYASSPLVANVCSGLGIPNGENYQSPNFVSAYIQNATNGTSQGIGGRFER